MKRLFFVLVMCFVWLVSCTETKVEQFVTRVEIKGGFDMEEEHDIVLSEKTMSIFIDREVCIYVSDLPKFRKAFSLANEKYKEWKKTAIENDVTDLYKKILVDFPPIQIIWVLDIVEKKFTKQGHKITASVGIVAGHQYLFLGCDGEVRDNKKKRNPNAIFVFRGRTRN